MIANQVRHILYQVITEESHYNVIIHCHACDESVLVLRTRHYFGSIHHGVHKTLDGTSREHTHTQAASV